MNDVYQISSRKPIEVLVQLAFILKALASWGGEVSETKNHPLCGCEIRVKHWKIIFLDKIRVVQALKIKERMILIMANKT